MRNIHCLLCQGTTHICTFKKSKKIPSARRSDENGGSSHGAGKQEEAAHRRRGPQTNHSHETHSTFTTYNPPDHDIGTLSLVIESIIILKHNNGVALRHERRFWFGIGHQCKFGIWTRAFVIIELFIFLLYFAFQTFVLFA